MQPIQIMKHVELFRGLSDDQLNQLVNISRREVFNEGDTIISQDSPGDCMYIIAEGQIEVQVRDDQGTVHPAVYLGEGQVFGEVAMLDEGLRSANVVAAQDSTVLYNIPRAAFNALCQSDTGLGFLVMRNIALDLTFKLRHRLYETYTHS